MARVAPLSQLSKHGSMEKCPVLGAVARERRADSGDKLSAAGPERALLLKGEETSVHSG